MQRLNMPEDPHMEEVFVDPEHALKRPNEVVFKLAFNEKGDLGLITSYQDVGSDVIFTGVGLSEGQVWLCKAPLAIKASLSPDALHNISKIFSSISSQPQTDHIVLEQIDDGPPSRIFSTGSIHSLFKALENLRENFDQSPKNDRYFGHPDFDGTAANYKFNFDMDSFLDAFDANEEGEDPPETTPEDPEYPFEDPDNRS